MTCIVAAVAASLLCLVARRILAVAEVSFTEPTLDFGPVVRPAAPPPELVIDLDHPQRERAELSSAA